MPKTVTECNDWLQAQRQQQQVQQRKFATQTARAQQVNQRRGLVQPFSQPQYQQAFRGGGGGGGRGRGGNRGGGGGFGGQRGRGGGGGRGGRGGGGGGGGGVIRIVRR